MLFAQDLQKLPWENMPSLRALPVTRLPSFRFLLSYSITKEVGFRDWGMVVDWWRSGRQERVSGGLMASSWKGVWSLWKLGPSGQTRILITSIFSVWGLIGAKPRGRSTQYLLCPEPAQ